MHPVRSSLHNYARDLKIINEILKLASLYDDRKYYSDMATNIIKNKIHSRYTYDRGHIVVLLFIIHINIVCCRCTFDRYGRALCFITRCNTSTK